MALNIKITAFVILIAAIALAVTFIISSNIVNQISVPQIEQRYLKEAQNTMLSVDMFLYDIYSDFKDLADNSVVKSSASSNEAIEKELLEFESSKKYFKSVSFFDLNERKLTGTDDIKIGTRYDLSKFRDDFSDGKKYSFHLSEESTAVSTIMSAAFLVENNGLPIGILTAEVDAEKIKNILDNLEGRVAIIDKNNNIVFTNDPVYKTIKTVEDLDSVKKASQDEMGIVYEYNQYHKGNFFTAFSKEGGYKNFNGNDWTILYSINKDVILSSSNSLNNTFIFYSLGVIILGIIFSLFLSKEVGRPIKELERVARAVMTGKEAQLPKEMKGEAQSLSKYLQGMMKDLNEARKIIDEYDKTLEHKIGLKTKELAETKTAVISTLEDVSKTKERLKRSYKKLKELDAQKDKFISVAAHELKTPLAAIQGFAKVLLDKKVSKDIKTKYLNIITNESKRLSDLVTDILDLSRIDLGTVKFDFRKVNPSPSINEVIEVIKTPIREKGLKFEYDVPKRLPKVMIDTDKFKQVVMNLLSNAMKYTLKGKVVFKAFVDDGSLHISVADSGIGMSKEQMKKLFTRFYRVETEVTRKISGTGLGLAISKEYVNAMESKIWAESKAGKGSTFHVTIPIGKR